MTPVRKRHPGRWVLIVLVPIVVLLAGIWLGGRPADLPSFMRSFAGSSKQKVVIEEAMKRIARDYYRPITESQLSNSSVSGMVAGLNDRFSHYLTPSELKEFDEPPHFAGIGVEVGPMERGLQIARVFDESPADRAGLKSGDVIVAVNGRPLTGLSRDQAVALIKGSPGTDVVLEIEGPHGAHAGKPPLHTVRITRALVSEPVVASATDTFKGKKLGVVALASFTPGSHAEVARAVQQVLKEGAQGIVFDLRDNGGGLVEEAQLIASNFIPHGVIVTTSGRTQPRTVLMATGGAISPKIPMVVLVDPEHGLGGGDRDRSAPGPPSRHGRRQPHVRQGRLPGGAETGQRRGARHHGRRVLHAQRPQPRWGGVRQGAGAQPEVKVAKGLDGSGGLKVALETLAAKVG